MDGARLIGKINPKHHVCYLPHDGKEVIQESTVTKTKTKTKTTLKTK